VWLSALYEGERPTTGGPDLDRVEARLAEHGAEMFGMVPPRPETQHAEEVTDPVPGS
jgi:hypothetical protein